MIRMSFLLLMVFLIQNTQNRDNDILHLKLDELIRATTEAQNAFLSLDHLDTKELHALRKRYSALGAKDDVRLENPEANAVSAENDGTQTPDAFEKSAI